MPETREQIIEQMAEVIRDVQAVRFVSPLHRELAGSVLPVSVKAVTDRVRELHTEQFWNVHDEVWRTNPGCEECGQAYPCPTVRLLDQIDAELGGE